MAQVVFVVNSYNPHVGFLDVVLSRQFFPRKMGCLVVSHRIYVWYIHW